MTRKINKTKTRTISLVLTTILIVVAAAWGYTKLDTETSSPYANLEDIPVFQVRKGPLKISVEESGTIRPRDQVILRNEMWDDTTILSIVEEGKRVQKGDLLVELDATQVEREMQTQKLELQNDEAEYISSRENLEVVRNEEESKIDQAELTLQFAEQDLKKYKEGEYPKQLKEAEAAITIAKAELNQAQEDLKWSKILYDEKYLSQSDLQQDELAAQQAKLSLDMAKEDLQLLKNYTHKRQLAQLNSDLKQAGMAMERTIRSASANIVEASSRYFWRQERYEEEKEDYRRLQEQVENSKIYAPIDGLALYASSVMEDWEDDEDRIRVGAEVDERREIIFLTAAEEYNVDIQVQETDLNKVEKGMPVSLTVDAIPEESFKGKVHYVSPLPNQRQQYLNPNLKVYNTDIQIEGEVEALRNGMSCKAEIIVEEYEDVIYVPIQAVVRVEGPSVVYVRNGNQVELRPVKIGMDNNRMLHIKEGLQEEEYVLLKPPLDGASDDNDIEEPTELPSNQLASESAE